MSELSTESEVKQLIINSIEYAKYSIETLNNNTVLFLNVTKHVMPKDSSLSKLMNDSLQEDYIVELISHIENTPIHGTAYLNINAKD